MLKEFVKALSKTVRLLRSFKRISYPAKDACYITVHLDKGYSLWVRKEKP
jgi:hypothetical protein